MIRTDRKLVVSGMACLAVANTFHWFVQRSGAVSEDWSDGLFGVCMGIGFGLLLLAIARGRRRA